MISPLKVFMFVLALFGSKFGPSYGSVFWFVSNNTLDIQGHHDWTPKKRAQHTEPQEVWLDV